MKGLDIAKCQRIADAAWRIMLDSGITEGESAVVVAFLLDYLKQRLPPTAAHAVLLSIERSMRTIREEDQN